MNRKIISAILFTGIVCALISCGVNTDPAVADGYVDIYDEDNIVYHEEDYIATQWENHEPEYNADLVGFNHLPDRDFGDSDFVFLADERARYTSELHTEEERGEPINDAVFKRNRIVSEKYNINIECEYSNDIWIWTRNNALAGVDGNNAVLLPAVYAVRAIQEGLLVDIANLPHISLENHWWDKSVRQLGVFNRNYLLNGDMLITNNEATQAIIFAKELCVFYFLENPYQLVHEGRWTFEKMFELMLSVGADLNGDGFAKPEDDAFGLYYASDSFLHSMLVAGGGTLVSKDSNDTPYINLTSDRSLNIINETVRLINRNWVISNSAVQGDYYLEMFQYNRLLFVQTELRELSYSHIMGLRMGDAESGILPMPKFDVVQTTYISPVNPETSAFLTVPVSVMDLHKTGFVLEALASVSYYVQEAYYDIALCGKFSRDYESKEMLDIIFNTRAYDMGAFYNFGGIYTGLIDFMGQGRTDITYFAERYTAQTTEAIERFIYMAE